MDIDQNTTILIGEGIKEMKVRAKAQGIRRWFRS
jgi:hypothetical protein